jgi:hypothetical protein
MQRRSADARSRFLQRIEEAAAAAGDEFGLDVRAFIQQYYRNTALDDLKDRAVEDLAGAALSHLRLALRRKPGAPCIRVGNPAPSTPTAGAQATASCRSSPTTCRSWSIHQHGAEPARQLYPPRRCTRC